MAMQRLESESTNAPETPVEIKRFTDEQKEALEKEGFKFFYELTESIKTLRAAGRPFWSTWHNKYPEFEALKSMESEVAINPKIFILPNSNNKTLLRQEALVDKFSQQLGEKVQGVKAIIGQVPDYVEIAFQHLDATQVRLFGVKYKFSYARTKTTTNDSDVGLVGNFNVDKGLDVESWTRYRGDERVYAAPLVVPA